MLGLRFLIAEEAAAIGKALSPLSVLTRNPLDHIVGMEELLLGAVELRSRDWEALEEADLEGRAVTRVAKSGGHGSSSIGSSP